ncbi:MAG TPA: hypothetical protein VI160_02600 [Gemmatimonadales bacterium]
MPTRPTTRWLIACAAALAAGCAFPTDDSAKVFVLVQAPRQFLLRGAEMFLHARAVRVVGTDTLEVPNVDFKWTTDNATLATVTKSGDSSAKVTGVNRGDVTITARAVNFNQAATGAVVIRVSNPIEIDSVRPAVVRYGEVLTVYGIGVDSLFLSSMAGVSLVKYPFSESRNPVTGSARISYWVPPPASSDSVFFLGAGVNGFSHGVTGVLPFDVYEPNDTSPAFIDLDAGGPWPQIPQLLFFNPALEFEPQPRGQEGDDWFKFQRSDTTRPTTFILTYPSFGDTLTRTFFADSVGSGFTFPSDVTFYGTQWHYCHNGRFTPLQVFHDSTILALKELPFPRMTVLTFFSNPLRYGLTVVDGYVTSDPRIKPDRFEENDFCNFADLPSRLINLTSGTFSDTLTIDNPFDIDWYKIQVPAPGLTDSLRIRLAARPFVALQDSSDIDVYVLNATGTPAEIGSSTNAGSSEYLALQLAAGFYYVVVVDYAGVPTRYSMCMGQGGPLASCALIPAPPAGAPRPKRPRLPSGAAPGLTPLRSRWPGSPFAPDGRP